MKNMISCIAVGFLLVTQNAWSGLPPTSVQGQADASPKTKFNFQVPNSQMTDLGGIKALLETGNQNVLKNPSFEASTFDSGWTLTTASDAVETTTIYGGAGKQSAKLTFSASTGDIAESVTPLGNTLGVNLEASCKVNTTMTTIQVCSLSGGSEIQCVNAPASGTWAYVSATLPGPANGTSVGVRVKTSASASGSVYVDDCYVGPSRLLAQGAGLSDTIVATTTITGSTTNPTKGTTSFDRFEYARMGDKMLIHVQYVQTAAGSAGSGTYLFQLPNSLQIDTSKLNVSTAATSNVGQGKLSNNSGSQGASTVPIHVFPYNATSLALEYTDASGANLLTDTGNVGSAAYSLASTNLTITFDAIVPISGWTSSQSGYRADVTPASWAGTSTLQGTTTATGSPADPGSITGAIVSTTNRNITCSAAASLLGITCTLPRTGNYQVCYGGYMANSSGSTGVNSELTDGSNSIVVGLQWVSITAATGQAPMGGCSNYLASSQTVTFKERGYVTSGTATYNPTYFSVIELDAPMPAPYLTGSVMSNSTTQGFHVDSIAFGGAGSRTAPTACSSSPCTIYDQSGSWVTSVTRNGVGDYSLVVASGEFSSLPWCFGMGAGVNITYNVSSAGVSGWTTTALRFSSNSAGSAADNALEIMCMGAH